MATVSRRFLITFGAQATKSGFSFLTGLVIARSLGPSEFGNFSFLLGSFAGLRLILDLSSSTAFFTLAAQRPRGRAFYLYYAIWLALVQVALPLLCLTVLLPAHVIDTLWESQARDRVWLAFLAGTMQYLFWPQVIQLGEIVRRTHLSQSLTIAIATCQFLLVVALDFLGWLTVPVIFAATAAEFVVGAILAGFLLPRPWQRETPEESFFSVFSEFRQFCQPLIVSAALTAANAWAETWMLQHFAGAVAQGYYSLGLQFANISLVAVTALQNIFWREMAELEGNGDDARVYGFYRRTSRTLLFTAAVPTFFLVAWTPEIVQFALGGRYEGGAPAVGVMFLYAIGQAIGFTAIVMFVVMRRTRALSIFAGGNMIVNMVVSYFVLAPATAPVPGLGLGALGLATKLVLLSSAYVLALEFWVYRQKAWPHDWRQRLRLFAILLIFSGVGRVAGGLGMVFLSPLLAMIGAGLLYTALIGATICWWPEHLGLSFDVRSALGGRFRRWSAAARPSP
jgi:O-antigen/teichoic acid export membrane protein